MRAGQGSGSESKLDSRSVNKDGQDDQWTENGPVSHLVFQVLLGKRKFPCLADQEVGPLSDHNHTEIGSLSIE